MKKNIIPIENEENHENHKIIIENNENSVKSWKLKKKT